MGTDLSGAIEFLVRALAGLALARWPDWYGDSPPFSPPDTGEQTAADEDNSAIDRMGAANPALNRAWARQAIHRCRSGEPPILRAFTPALQVRESRRLKSYRETIHLVICDLTVRRSANVRRAHIVESVEMP